MNKVINTGLTEYITVAMYHKSQTQLEFKVSILDNSTTHSEAQITF